MKSEELQNGVLITNLAAAGDGGSLFLECESKQNSKFNLLFTQYTFLDNPNPEMLPGRIYLNQKLIGLKSEDEKMILLGIENFDITNDLLKIDPNLKSDLVEAIKKLRSFFDSNLSIEIKEKVDSSLYHK